MKELAKPGYRFRMPENGAFEVHTPDGRLPWIVNQGVPFLPITNRAVVWGAPTPKHETRGDDDVFTFEMPSNNLYENPRSVVVCRDDYVEMYFKARVRRRMCLNRWAIFQPGTKLDAIDVFDFRSHIESPHAYEVHQTILARRKLGTHGLDITTEDSDLMFSPHPMLFVYRHLDNQLVVGPMGLINGESLQVRMERGKTIVQDYSIRIGQSIYWLEEGEELESPHFMICQKKTQDVYDMLTHYTNLLTRDGHTRRKTEDELHDWWLAPMWCSWGDQHSYFVHDIKYIPTAFTAEARQRTKDAINVDMVGKITGAIEKWGLPVRTLILDDAWYTRQGDMYAHPDKFPDMRGTVDDLHKRGYKVMCWASLYQFDSECETFRKHPEWFVLHETPRSQHLAGNPGQNAHLDFSNREVAEEYLGELLERLLSDKPGCYNFDGIKFDWTFMVPHDYPYPDRDWVGKEKTIYNSQKVIYDIAKRYKKDALIIGVSPHPFFQDVQDIIRTYDVSTYDTTIHLERAEYIKAIAPGMTAALDEHLFHRNFHRYMEEASKVGIPMLYNLLRFNGDAHVYTDEDYRRLKPILDGYVESAPRLRDYMASLPRLG